MSNKINKNQIELLSNNNFLLGTPKKNKNNKFKKPLIIKLYWYLLVKLFSLISVSTITIVTIFSSIILPIVFLSISHNEYNQIQGLQYFILIFYNIFLFIFILFISVRIFLNQIEDNSFLLVITKPYSRIKIILIQYLVIISATVMLILLSTFCFFLVSSFSITSKNSDFSKFINHMVICFLLFSLFFAFMLINSIIIISSLFSSKTVFLFFSVVCSLFILGSLPYSLFSAKINQTIITLKNKPMITYQELNESIKFHDYLSQNLIKYPVVTKKIYNFISNFKYDDIVNNYYLANEDKRLDFFKENNLVTFNRSNSVTFSVDKWKTFDIFKKTNSTLELKFANTIKTIKQIQDDVDGNYASDVEKEILEIYQDNINATPNFLSFLYANKTSLLNGNDKALFALSSVSYNGQDLKDNFNRIISDYINDNNSDVINFSTQIDQKNFENSFENPTLFILISLEQSILNEATIYIHCRDEPLNDSDDTLYSYDYYKKIMSEYMLLNKINFFEHWNQLWTSLLGTYGNFDFDLTTLKLRISFEAEQNSFFSYPIYYLGCDDNDQLQLVNNNPVQNFLATVISYLVVSLSFFSLSLVIWKYKNII